MDSPTNEETTMYELDDISPRIARIVKQLRSLTNDDLDFIIHAAEYELRERAFEEQDKQDYDDLLARQYEADQADDFIRRAV